MRLGFGHATKHILAKREWEIDEVMTPYDARLVHATIDATNQKPGLLAKHFDERLNAIDPKLRSILATLRFEDGARFIDVLVASIAGVGQPDALDRSVQALVRRQGDYVWQSRRQAVVGQGLIAALAATLGDTFTEEARQAWTNGYVILAEAMLRATCNRLDLVA